MSIKCITNGEKILSKAHETNKSSALKAIALDTGGTMTDSFLIDEQGRFAVGKALTTPEDEFNGIYNSISDSLSHWNAKLEDSGRTVDALVYSGTIILNKLLERKGNDKIGVITNAGFEDVHRLGRALQCWIGLDFAGRLHAREHEHPKPLVPRKQIKGVRGRINFTGSEIIPLYKEDVEKATEELLEMGVEVICICFLCSYMNTRHEKTAQRIAEKLIKKKGKDIPVVISSEHLPIRGETPRLNALIIEQYAAAPSRKMLLQIAKRFKEVNVPTPLRILTSYGGTISPEHDQLILAMNSGPMGGMVGCMYLAKQYGIKNLVSSDVGGTSFDVGLTMEKYIPTKWQCSLGGFVMNIPMIASESIGAGTGMYVRYNDISGRLEFGPKSAGYRIGVSNEKSGVKTVTMTDCSLILGYLNPQYFLGGRIPLNKDLAYKCIAEQLAEPFKADPYVTARGALDLIELNMRNHLRGMVEGLGFRPENYTLVSYGGGGPLHVAGYSKDLRFEDVLIPEWAPAFSAFGCACADHSYRYEKTIDGIIPPDGRLNQAVSMVLNATWGELKKTISKEFEREGRNSSEMIFKPSVRLQYLGMLDDLEVPSPLEKLSPDDMWKITRSYDNLFEEIFKRGTKSPELGYHITKAVATGIVPVPKPKFPEHELHQKEPPEAASKGHRQIFWLNNWHEASIWEIGLLKSGNNIDGPAVLEAPATTMLVPPKHRVTLDKHRIFHMEVP